MGPAVSNFYPIWFVMNVGLMPPMKSTPSYSLSQNRNPILTAPSKREPYAFLAEASSPKCSQCEMKRGDDGAAVKIHRRPKP